MPPKIDIGENWSSTRVFRLSNHSASLSRRTRARLTKFLSGLPEMRSARLAHAVELDRARGGTGLPHDEILNALRPRLRRLYEARKRERNALQRILETVPREIHNALPIKPMGGFGTNDAPLDLSTPPARKKFRRATGFAQILARLRGPAATYGMERHFLAARAEIVSSIRAFQRGLVRELRAARAGDFAEAYRRPALALGAKVLSGSELTDLQRARPIN